MGSKISLLVHGDRQYTWIPTTHVADSSDSRKGFLNYRQRAQSEFCKFVVECFKHKRANCDLSHAAAAVELPAPLRADSGGLVCKRSNDDDGVHDAAAAAAGSDDDSSGEDGVDSSDDDSSGEDGVDSSDDDASTADELEMASGALLLENA
jgi:hypothetical protein